MNISFHKKAALAAAFALTATAAIAPAPAYAYSQPIYLEINQSYYLPQVSPIKRVAVTNPDIADVIVIDKNAINVVAKKSGSTSLTIWTANGMRQEFTISVTGADSGLGAAIQKAIGLPHVEVTVVGEGDNKKILLKGTVANQYEKDMAYRIACLYAGGNAAPDKPGDRDLFDDSVNVVDSKENNDNVVNLLEMVNPDQINIEAEVLEVNANDAAQLGAIYSGSKITSSSTTSSNSNSSSSSSSTTSSSTTSTTLNTGTFTFDTATQVRDKGKHWYNRNWFFTHFSDIYTELHLLVTQGHARVISRPNITTMSGKSAGILIGGQIPYPKSNGSSSGTSVDYKDYGIKLNLIEPTVDRSGNITSRVLASVSRIDWSNAVTVDGFRMPGLATRTAETMVNIPTGMTMVIGGLLNSDDSKSLSKVPILGDIPIIGELFKYHNDSKEKTEIIILLTPRVVNETTPATMSSAMRDNYARMKQEDETLEHVDLNASERPKTDKELKEEAKAQKKAEAEQPAPKKTQEEDSILGKYLDQSVLKGTTKAEHDAAVRANQE
ncbi:pilus assembly protein N-terminal domain-containing protein [Selenomonas sp.]|uniref:type II and III secretion system protein family protein n=1 Tax=Selenomonas sp. TaxID=2053611 RepID=UPI0025DC514F|nr:pilus assembly protein N-terminal domain-containing protein [Selenomonas sp.]MCI6283556.1 pilus assembly protein N-terminal domain-containing protein [Selenomonas sp.]